MPHFPQELPWTAYIGQAIIRIFRVLTVEVHLKAQDCVGARHQNVINHLLIRHVNGGRCYVWIATFSSSETLWRSELLSFNETFLNNWSHVCLVHRLFAVVCCQKSIGAELQRVNDFTESRRSGLCFGGSGSKELRDYFCFRATMAKQWNERGEDSVWATWSFPLSLTNPTSP